MQIKTVFVQTRWGEKSFVALYISILSGLVVALQYDAATPFYSVGTIDLLIPFGAFWRSLHFYSSQVFFLFCLCHFTAILLEPGRLMPPRQWLLLVFSLPVSLLLLFTGYVLRGDATGESAGNIAENIALSIPLFGTWVNDLLFSVAQHGVQRVYANHLIGLVVLWVVLCWDHVRRYQVGFRQHGLLTVALLSFCLFWPAPVEPYGPGVFYIAGPWFFLGLQEMLGSIQPFWAGVLFPSLLIGALCLIPYEKWRRRALFFVGGWLVLYAGLTLVSVFRG